MKLNYFDLLSPTPINIQNVGNVVSPKLKDIAEIGVENYNFYNSILLADSSFFYSLIGQEAKQNSEENIYDLFTSNDNTSKLLQDALNFFFVENVIFYKEEKIFLVVKDINDIENSVVGTVNRYIYNELTDVILQLNNIKKRDENDISKIKSKKAMKIAQKIKNFKSKMKSNKKKDENMELGNIISVVANRHKSINMTNVYQLTVYQLWDSYFRLIDNSIYEVQSTSAAVWGDKDFDVLSWTKKINN